MSARTRIIIIGFIIVIIISLFRHSTTRECRQKDIRMYFAFIAIVFLIFTIYPELGILSLLKASNPS